ncbi:threonine synthase [soil metagenome]
MRYVSTRGRCPDVGFTEALLAGLAPDGGLYTPARWPELSDAELKVLAGRPYAQVAAAVLARFAEPELTREQLLPLCEAAYATFSHPAVAPLRQLDADLWLLDLACGPTLAFKDVAMQILARLYETALKGSGRRLTLVVATSGDTGGAAVEAFANSPAVRMVVLFPEGKISEVQRRFMTTVQADNVRCVAIDGSFDDCQAVVKSLFADEAFRAEVDLSGVNSINWARIAAQSVYYVTSALALGAPERAIAYTVPSGNFGDAFAGYAALRMGLPIAGITVATNANDILPRTLSTGRYARGSVVETTSPAMDIQVASNFERLAYEATDRDAATTAALFEDFALTGVAQLPEAALTALRTVFAGASVDESTVRSTIREVWSECGVLIDPHTAVGVAAARRHPAAPGTPHVVLSTAHPAKFPEAVEEATGEAAVPHSKARDLAAKPERIDRLPANAQAVAAYVREFVAA